MGPLASPTTTAPASPPAIQTAAAEAGVGAGAGAGASASTLIDLGATSQQAQSTETPVPSVLENELKALGKSVYSYWRVLRIWSGRAGLLSDCPHNDGKRIAVVCSTSSVGTNRMNIDDDDDDMYNHVVCQFTCLCSPNIDKLDNHIHVSNSMQIMLCCMCVASCFMKFFPLVGLHDIEPPPAATNSQIPLQV